MSMQMLIGRRFSGTISSEYMPVDLMAYIKRLEHANKRLKREKSIKSKPVLIYI